MSDALPFRIKARHTGNENAIFIAFAGDDEIAHERYRVGDGAARRRTANRWSKDERLSAGTALDPVDIACELEDAERRVRESLDRGDACTENGPGQATSLVRMAEQHAELFHDTEGDAFASISVDEHQETYAVRSRKFRRWLSRMYYLDEDRTPNSQAMADSLGVIEGKALFAGDRLTVHVRLAEHNGAIYVDLGGDDWSVAEVTSEGWTILSRSPVEFLHPRGMKPLPVPVPGGDLSDLRQFVNVRSDEDFVLVVAWLIGAFCPRGPYPVLAVTGEQGSAKSTTCRVLRRLVDPNLAPLRASPRNEQDLIIAAKNSHVCGIDNVSRLPAWLSDALCRLSTGAGFGTRALFTDGEEHLFAGQRPILLNGIGDVATSSDLLDRSLILNLPAMADADRRDEKSFWTDFELAAPRILGAILDAVGSALRNDSSAKPAVIPRMADFALWIIRAEPRLPWPAGAFLSAYMENRASGNELALEDSPVGAAILSFMSDRSEWVGSCTELLAELDAQASEKIRGLKSWPRQANTLGCLLRRVAPNLRAMHISVEFGSDGRDRGKRRVLAVRRIL